MKKLFVFVLLLIFFPFVYAMEEDDMTKLCEWQKYYTEMKLVCKLQETIQGYQDITELLTQEINVNAGGSILIWLIEVKSCFASLSPYMEQLITAGADVNASDENGTVLQRLVSRSKKRLDGSYSENSCFDRWGGKKEEKELLQMLLTAGAKIGKKDSYGKTVLDYEIPSEYKKILEQEISKRRNIRKREQPVLLFKNELSKDKDYYASLLPQDVVNKVAQYYENSDI